ncbi:MAG: hypothetical protein AUG91_02920 [Actinobacteria bacterium 13_1_20CM_4_69_9]|jgi:hypothetical protein|nr:MAG: hypothetical protein AUG91_02920 [Actinobacteria bacterium 13_1_20CM_4_69_9]
MAMLIRFTPSGMTSEQYNSVGKKLEDGGHWPPPGLLAHVCFGSSGNLRVSEVWESRQQQEQFAESLMPLLQEENVDLTGEPEILDVEGYFMREASSDAGD